MKNLKLTEQLGGWVRGMRVGSGGVFMGRRPIPQVIISTINCTPNWNGNYINQALYQVLFTFVLIEQIYIPNIKLS